jgi:hypothetical protein
MLGQSFFYTQKYLVNIEGDTFNTLRLQDRTTRFSWLVVAQNEVRRLPKFSNRSSRKGAPIHNHWKRLT